MTEKSNVITAEQASDIIEKEKIERAERCRMKVQKDLDDDNCQIRALPFINADGRIVVQVDIIAQ